MGKDIDWLRKVWEDQGDLAKLLHATWDPRHPYRTEALLDADGVFYPTVLAGLRARVGAGRTDLQTGNLTVDLAATLQSGPPLPDRDTGADLRPRTAHFRFRRIPGPATCGRSTTSRPAPVPTTTSPCGGWRTPHGRRARSRVPSEPASVFSWPGRGRERSADDDLPDSMATVFSEVAPTANRAFDVMDWAVFTKIPSGAPSKPSPTLPPTSPRTGSSSTSTRARPRRSRLQARTRLGEAVTG